MTHNFEIVDWEEHVDDLMELVRRKCERAYPAYFTLVVLGRRATYVDLNTITSETQKLKVPFEAIWIIGRTRGSFASMAQVYPAFERLDFDVEDCLRRAPRSPEFLVPEGRSKSTEFTDLGALYLPIP